MKPSERSRLKAELCLALSKLSPEDIAEVLENVCDGFPSSLMSADQDLIAPLLERGALAWHARYSADWKHKLDQEIQEEERHAS